MRILRLEIENYCNIEQLCWDGLGRVVTVIGHNGAGKTTALNALRLALFGRNQHTDKRGRHPKNAAVRHGAAMARIGVTTDTAAIDVTVASDGKTAWSAVVAETGEVVQTARALWGDAYDAAELASGLGACRTIEECCALLRTEIDYAYNWGAVSAYAPDLCDAGVIRIIEELSGNCPDDVHGLAQWRAVGGAAYARRTERKRALADRTAALNEMGWVPPPRYRGDLMQPGDTDVLVELQADKTLAREACQARLESARAGIAQETLDTLKWERDAVRRIVVRADDAVQEAEALRLAAVEQMDSARIVDTKARMAYTDAQHTVDACVNGACPTCGHVFDTGIEPLQDVAERLKRASDEAASAYDAAKAACHSVEARLREKHSALCAANRDAGTVCARYDAAVSVGVSTEDPEAVEREIAALEADMAEISAALYEQTRHADYVALKSVVADLQCEVDSLTVLCEQLHNHGGAALCHIAQGSGVPVCVQNANRLLDAEPHALSWDGADLCVRYDGGGGAWTLGKASRGEQAMARWAICTELARGAGAPVMLDGADALDAVRAHRVQAHILEDTNGPQTVIARHSSGPMRVLGESSTDVTT